MKIIILHGDKTDELYQRLDVFKNEAKKRDWEIRNIDIQQDIKEQLVKKGLFASNSFFVIKEANKLLKKDLNWINDSKDNIEGTLIMYSENTLPKTYLNNLKNADKTEEYKLPVLIWRLLESIYPGNSRNCIKLMHEVLKKEAPEFVFALISKHVRDLIWANLENNKLPYPSWRISKLRTQARKFKSEELKIIIQDLSIIDLKIKTSRENVSDSLDLLFITRLE